ncbi:MAG: glycosyltransferase family 9 protein, partial [Pseudomonadota bacterium]
MNADLMRKIDRRLGAPLCRLLTLSGRIGRLLGRKGRPAEPFQRILFIELAESGGLVVAYPALIRAKALFPEAELYFLTFQAGKDLLPLMKVVDRSRVILIHPHSLTRFFKDTIRTILWLRKERLDATVNLEAFSRYSAILAYLSGAETRVGFHPFFQEGGYVGDLVTHRVIYNPHRHAAYSFLSLVESLAGQPGIEPGAKSNFDQADLRVQVITSTPEARRAMQNKLREAFPGLTPRHRLVLLNPNAGDLVTVRRWPEENFLRLAQALLKEPEVMVVLTGSPEERPMTELLARKLGSDRVLNLAGQTSIPELIDLYNLSDLLITNDSGPAHFASLTDIPVLVMFGPETPDI